MTNNDKNSIIKFIKGKYINYINSRHIDRLIDLLDEISINHPCYNSLEGFIEWICKQTNTDRQLIMELENANSIDTVYSIIKCKHNVYLRALYLDGVKTLLGWLSWKHPRYESLEFCIKFASERSQLFDECIDYLNDLAYGNK